MLSDLVEQTQDPVFLRALVSQSLLASNSTTSWLVSNAFFSLARQPDIWERLRQESLAQDPRVLASPGSTSGLDLHRKVLWESKSYLHTPLSCVTHPHSTALRLYPIFPNLARVALEDTRLPTGGGPSCTEKIFIPKGTTVVGSAFVLHRKAEVFGPDVEVFRPDRWDSIKPGRYEYLPFGSGSRDRKSVV